MRSLLLIATLIATPAAAKECYRLVEDPEWTITINDPGVEPEWLWQQGDKTVAVTTGSAGTGIPVRVAYDPDWNGYSYIFHKGDLIVDMSVYEPVACD
jgi:hypothetical protein